jgi:hypothetical protein
MVDNALADWVRERANHCCEYCRFPQAFSSTTFQIDHIFARQHGGRTVAANLAFACLADNNHKGPNLAGIDPKTGKRTWLFHPRRQKWSRHFRWQGPIFIGRTPVGRATIAVLGINLPARVLQREALIAEAAFPPPT